jgi:3',5'-cyclic AMP phosphodiesterase CpdA
MRLLPLLFVPLLAGCGGCGTSTSSSAGPDASPVSSADGGDVKLVVGGDSRDDKAHVVPWAFREAKARGAAAFLFLGDMELTPELDRAFAHELTLLDPIPFYPVLGNHEVEQMGFLSIGRAGAERALAHRFLGTPRTPVRSALPGRLVYSVDLPGGVHFVALDNVSQRGFGKDQLTWLADDLNRAHAEPATRHILVGMHKPLAHNGIATHGMDHDGLEAIAESDAALALFVASHVELILASHVHQFTEFRQAGIPSYITGGLGAPLTRSGPERAFHHFLLLDVADSGIRVEVVRFGGPPSVEPEGEDDDD